MNNEWCINIIIFIVAVLAAILITIHVYNDAGEDRTAIVTEKYEVGGAYFVKIVIPVDEETYIGLDIGDECTFEE